MNFPLALICSIIYFSIKFFEVKVLKKDIQLKDSFRNSLLVGFSVILGDIILGQINHITTITDTPPVFINDPEF